MKMMMWTTRLRLSLATRRQHARRRRCYCSVVPRCSANNNVPSLILASSSSPHITRTFFSKSLIRFSIDSRSIKHSNKNDFLIPGFQPTIITGDNIGFYHGSTFYDGTPPNVLPILNASPILSPGKYVRQSSWSSSADYSKRGTKSGTDAALRLVDARREFMSLMNRELLLLDGSQQFLSNNNSNHRGSDEVVVTDDVRKIYALTGHGVPSELLLHLIQVVRGWTASSSSPQSRQTHLSSIVQVSFQNVHNSTLLDRDQIQVIHDNGITSKLIGKGVNQMLNHGGDWEHVFDLYMVVMDRIASRLASFALLHPPHPRQHSHDDIMSNNTVDGKEVYNNNEDEATIGSSGSVITPASLKKWNVTMMKGEALPLSLLPVRTNNERQQQPSSNILTVEWVLNKRKNDCCNIILRLQDDGSTAELEEDGRGREPMSLVFDGMYV